MLGWAEALASRPHQADALSGHRRLHHLRPARARREVAAVRVVPHRGPKTVIRYSYRTAAFRRAPRCAGCQGRLEGGVPRGLGSVRRAPKCFHSLRSASGSTVEDADLTNSPIPWSRTITSLLSTPNSWAIS